MATPTLAPVPRGNDLSQTGGRITLPWDDWFGILRKSCWC
jgi:hypothetical protein